MAIIKGFIFDLDGVIVDTARYHFLAWQRLAAELDISFSEKENEQLKGIGRRESLELILQWGQKEISEERKLELMQRKNEWYLEYVETMGSDEALPGAKEFIDRALNLNLKIALGSASKNALIILEKLQITNKFSAIIDGTKTTRSKPDPQVFTLGAEEIDLKPEELVVFEDSQAGVDAAKSGGFRTVGIGNKKVLGKAEIVIAGLDKITPAEIINKLNF